MTWLLPLLRHRITWGVGIALGGLVAIAAHGRLKYAEGFRDGSAQAAAAAQIDAAAARAVSDSVWSVLHAATIRSRDAQRIAEKAAARAETRTRVAMARLSDALAAYRADTVVQSATCDALASSCANAAALWTHERDTLTVLIAVQDTVVIRQSEMIANEPQRLADAMRVALAEQRRTFRGPSRVTWSTLGAIAGAVLTLGVMR